MFKRGRRRKGGWRWFCFALAADFDFGVVGKGESIVPEQSQKTEETRSLIAGGVGDVGEVHGQYFVAQCGQRGQQAVFR